MSSQPPWKTDDESPPWKIDDTVGSGFQGAQEIKAQPPLWKRALSEAGGFFQEIPLMGMRAVNLLGDVGQGKQPWDRVREMEREARTRKITEALGGSEISGLPEQRPGRIAARMLPAAVTAYATGGMSLPAQSLIQGGVQGLQSLSEGATPEAALTGAGIAGLGAPVAKGLNIAGSFFKAPFKKSVDTAALNAAQRMGIELPASAITDSSRARALEQMASRMVGGGGIEQRGTQALDEIAARAQQMGSAANPMVAGQATAADVAAQRASLQALKNAEYAKVGSLTDIPGVPDASLADIDRMLAAGTSAPDVLAHLKTLRGAIAPKKTVEFLLNGQPVSDDLAKAMEQELALPGGTDKLRAIGVQIVEKDTPRSVADLMSQQAGLEYGGPNALADAALSNRLRQGLGGDIDRILAQASPDQLAQLEAAKAAYGTYADFSKSQLGKVATGLGQTGQFDKIAEAVLKPNTSTADLQKLMQVTSPETQNQLKEVLLRKIIGNAESVTPKQIERGLYTYGKVAKALLSPDQLQQLRDLSTVRKAMGKTTIGSPTTPLLQARKYIETPARAAMAGSLGGMAGIGGELAAETIIAKILGSQGGQKWLTTGFGPAVMPGRVIRGISLGTQRIPSEVQAERRRRELESLFAGR